NTIYIDKNYSKKLSPYISSDMKHRDDEELYVSFGIANAAEGETKLTTFTHSVRGTTFGNATEKLDAETSRRPFFGHTKLVIFGKELIDDPELFTEVLDDLERNTSIDRELKIVVAENSNITLEALRPSTENLYSSYIDGVMSAAKSISFTIPMSMGQFFNDLRQSEGRAVVPVVRMEGEKIKMDKVLLIDKYTSRKTMSSREVRGYKFFHGVDSNIMEYMKLDDTLTSFKMTKIEKYIHFTGDEKNIKFTVKYNLYGEVTNYAFQKQIFDNKTAMDLEKKVIQHMNKQLIEITDYFQNDIGLDYLAFNEYMIKYHPKVYKANKDWDAAFRNAEIDFKVDVNIQRFGDSK
ncbi:MAG: Ger(x)C family spore germination C-terminal domain-containing protein, partial [Clostridium sp.]